ncbi:MAG: hypothetical protein ABFR89_05990, partial [Actinomycetota bacterium]
EGLVADEAPAEAAPTPAAVALSGAALLTAVAEARGMPESLVERSAKARAKKTDTTVEDVLNEWAREEGLVSSPSGGGVSDEGADGGGQAAPATTASGGVTEADAAVQEPAAALEPAPEAKRKLHSLVIAAIAAVGIALVLSVLMAFVDVPSSSADAPWYTAGLEPFVAVVILPAVLLVAIVAAGFVAWSPRIKPSIRRFALLVLAFLVVAIVVFLSVGALLA